MASRATSIILVTEILVLVWIIVLGLSRQVVRVRLSLPRLYELFFELEKITGCCRAGCSKVGGRFKAPRRLTCFG
jgi:hypothetical protein